MSASSFSEPFVLSTYNSSLRGRLPEECSQRALISSHVREDKSEQYATVAVPADGLHIVDVDNLHPVAANTLGPSCSFQCAPLTIPLASKHKWKTYAVGITSTDPSSSRTSGRTIWTWESDSQSVEKTTRTQTILSEGQSIRALHACDDLPNRVLAFSSAGALSVLDAESLETRALFAPKRSQATFLDAWVFSRNDAPFGDHQHGALAALLLVEDTSSVKLRLVAVGESDSISQLHEQDIPISAKDITSLACSHSGSLSILQRDGTWSLYQLSSAPFSEPESSLRLENFPYTASSTGTATLALTSSHVLIASVSSSQQIILQIWDLRFSVLLASHILAIPASLFNSSSLSLSLTAAVDAQHTRSSSSAIDVVSGQAYLVAFSISTPSKESIGSSSSTKLRSVVFVLPYTVPRISTVAAALGRGAISSRWISSNATESSRSATSTDVRASEQKEMLLSLKTSLDGGRAQIAEGIFMKWVGKVDENTHTAMLDHNSVKRILELVLIPPTDSTNKTSHSHVAKESPYAAEIVQYLLERRVVSSVMLASYGGLLAVLRARGDWRCIELAFSRVLDLTELEIVETLAFVLAHHKRSLQPSAESTEDADAMQVDGSKGIVDSSASESSISLANYISLMASYPTSRFPLVLALRRYLQNPEDVTSTLAVLSDFVVRRTKLEMELGESRKLLPGKKDLKKTAEGVWVVAKRKEKEDPSQQRVSVPDLEKLTFLVQCVLDASFLVLLSHKPSHRLLSTLATQLSPEVAFARASQGLLGALEPFALAQQKAYADSLLPRQERQKEKQKQDWKQRRRTANVDIGSYALEELSL